MSHVMLVMMVDPHVVLVGMSGRSSCLVVHLNGSVILRNHSLTVKSTYLTVEHCR